MGIKVPLPKTMFNDDTRSNLRKVLKPVPINKVGDYYKGEDGNMTFQWSMRGKPAWLS